MGNECKCGLDLAVVVVGLGLKGVRSKLGSRGVGWNGFEWLHGFSQVLEMMGR